MYSQLPIYQRQGEKAYKINLDKMRLFTSFLGNPEKKIKSIHIGGTNGKGSTSHLISSVLQEAGYKVGLYTSPHLKSFKERIRINGLKVSSSFIVDFINKNLKYITKNKLSFFEITVGMAFKYFSIQKVDIAIIEVGLGGRLDATNVIISPELSVITNIGLEHTFFLGDTRKKIAKEKAGIIKEKSKVIIGEKDKETLGVFESVAKNKNAIIKWTSEIEDCNYKSDLIGEYQKLNINCSYLALKSLDGFKILEHHFVNGFKSVYKNTGLRCRWEIISENPKIIFDISHNKYGFEYVVKQLSKEKFNNLHMVLGFVKGKQIEDIFKILPVNAYYYLCTPSVERAFDLDDLKLIAENYNLKYVVNSSVKNAFEKAKANLLENDIIYVGGSTFVCAEII